MNLNISLGFVVGGLLLAAALPGCDGRGEESVTPNDISIGNQMCASSEGLKSMEKLSLGIDILKGEKYHIINVNCNNGVAASKRITDRISQ